MLLLDDHLARVALSGRRWPGWGSQIPVLPWTLHVRLLRALLDSRTLGRLSRSNRSAVLAATLAPPPDVLEILDPRPLAVATAQLKIEHNLSIAAAELLAAAITNDATVHIAESNVGRKWPEILANTAVKLYVYERNELE